MKLEKRALLAFVASMLLFLAYDALYLSPKMEKARRRQAQEASQRRAAGDTTAVVTPAPDTLVSSEETEELASDAYAPDTIGVQAARLPEADIETAPRIVVATPLFEITISCAGAEVTSTRLLKYTTNDQPVELFPQYEEGDYPHALNVSLEGDRETTRLTGVRFEAYRGGVGDALLDGARIEVGAGREYTDIVFRAGDGSEAVERYYRFYPNRYNFETGVRFATGGHPDVTRVVWGMGPGMQSTEANVADDQHNFKATVQLGDEFHRLRPSHFGKEKSEEFSGTLVWASLQTKYFLSALIPPEPTRADIEVSGNKEDNRVSTRIALPAIAKQNRVDQAIDVYLGPLDIDALETLGVGLEKNIEMGWRLLRPVSVAVLWSMKWMYRFIPNYGLVIIIISVLTKVLFYRLTHKSFKSMKDLQDLQPRLMAIKEKYKDDKQKQSQETMRLYKEAGVNPLGGCFPMLLQMPVFIALFNVLKYTIELRGAPFAGWITDLSQQEVLFRMPFSLPLIGDAFSLLPILMGGSMLLQTKLGGSVTGGAPGGAGTPAGMQTLLPIVFTFLFYKMPSGLVIYWIVNTVLSIAQQYYIHNYDKKPDDRGPGKKTQSIPKKRLKMKEG